MSAEIIEMNIPTRVDLDPDRLLEKAKGQLSEVLILGYTKDGEEYFSTSKADAAQSVWLCERGKYRLMKMVDKLSEEG